ncbi:hypothetical protein V4Q83_19540 (plasmid) [Acinetobacter baumannii]
MTDKVNIVNNALSLIGASSITSFEENTANARRVKTIYDTSRKALLRLHPFQCSIKRIKLSPLAEAPVFGYSYQYQLPDDLIRIINANTEDYAVETDKLLSNNNELNLVYVFDNRK